MVKLSLLLLLLVCLGVHYHVLAAQELDLVRLTHEPDATGAKCLDGSPPAYYIRQGSGDGANKWVLHLMGGAWCSNPEDCYSRSFTILGSTTDYFETFEFPGILSGDNEVNPDFYNWNVVFFIYCDGASFAGDREELDVVFGRNIYYRGYRNLQAIFSHLNQEKGLTSATDVILTGCSAGGLAVLLHADFVSTLIPADATYRALPDAGYIPDLLIQGVPLFQETFTNLTELQNVSQAIPPDCVSDNNETLWRCLVGPYLYDYINTPLYVINSQYDSLILETYTNLTCPGCADEAKENFIEAYKARFDMQAEPVFNSPSTNGYFFDSCSIHCQTIENDLAWNEVEIDGVTMAKSFGDWYFNRSTNTRLVDCVGVSCNPTCPENIASGGAKVVGSVMVLSTMAVFAAIWN